MKDHRQNILKFLSENHMNSSITNLKYPFEKDLHSVVPVIFPFSLKETALWINSAYRTIAINVVCGTLYIWNLVTLLDRILTSETGNWFSICISIEAGVNFSSLAIVLQHYDWWVLVRHVLLIQQFNTVTRAVAHNEFSNNSTASAICGLWPSRIPM